jgi:hypothetical protein
MAVHIALHETGAPFEAQRVMARLAVKKTIEIEEKIGYSLPR